MEKEDFIGNIEGFRITKGKALYKEKLGLWALLVKWIRGWFGKVKVTQTRRNPEGFDLPIKVRVGDKVYVNGKGVDFGDKDFTIDIEFPRELVNVGEWNHIVIERGGEEATDNWKFF